MMHDVDFTEVTLLEEIRRATKGLSEYITNPEPKPATLQDYALVVQTQLNALSVLTGLTRAIGQDRYHRMRQDRFDQGVVAELEHRQEPEPATPTEAEGVQLEFRPVPVDAPTVRPVKIKPDPAEMGSLPAIPADIWNQVDAIGGRPVREELIHWQEDGR